MRVEPFFRTTALAGLVSVTLVAASSGAWATYPGGNGDIGYATLGRSLAVRGIGPDGTDDHKISIGRADAGDLEFFSDGSAAVVVEYPGRGSRLVHYDLASTTRTVILPATEAPRGSIFSVGVAPDDSAVIFCTLQSRGWRLYTVDMDGTGLTRISRGTDDCHADWGVNGRIAATEELTSRARRVFTMLPDGSDRQTVVRFPPPKRGWVIEYCVVPSWSPDASHLAFGAQRNDQNPDVWSIAADGTALTNVTGTKRRDEYGPVFSPDESLIAFTREQVSRRFYAPGDLWRMDTAGEDPVRLTDTRRRDEYSRSWQALTP